LCVLKIKGSGAVCLKVNYGEVRQLTINPTLNTINLT